MELVRRRDRRVNRGFRRWLPILLDGRVPRGTHVRDRARPEGRHVRVRRNGPRVVVPPLARAPRGPWLPAPDGSRTRRCRHGAAALAGGTHLTALGIALPDRHRIRQGAIHTVPDPPDAVPLCAGCRPATLGFLALPLPASENRCRRGGSRDHHSDRPLSRGAGRGSGTPGAP